MNTIEILVISRQPESLQILLRLINNNQQWNATTASTNKEAIELFQRQTFNLVLLGAGIDKESELKLSKLFCSQNLLLKLFNTGEEVVVY